MFDRKKHLRQEQHYAQIMNHVIQTILKKYGAYFVATSSYDTGGIATEPWKRHVTFIFKSAEVHEQAKHSGLWAQIVADTRAALANMNTGQHDDLPQPDLYAIVSADIDAINAAGGYYYYFK